MSHAVRTPAMMRVRLAVRHTLAALQHERAEDQRLRPQSLAEQTPQRPLALVALSGGADSLALAAAAALEAAAAGARIGAVIIDHQLQPGSAEVAQAAAAQATTLGLAPVIVRTVHVAVRRDGSDGATEAAARTARYDAISQVAVELGAAWVFTAHTRDDQAEQVLLALARGSGTRSLAGIPPVRPLADTVLLVRPLLDERSEVTRDTTVAACREVGLDPWQDPHNADPTFTRVRVRNQVLPVMQAELGHAVAANLARSADLAREDADALDALASKLCDAILDLTHVPHTAALAVSALADQPSALRNRVIRLAARRLLGTQLTRGHTLAIASLITDWRGQGPIQVPGATVSRRAGQIVFRAATSAL